MQNSFNNNLKKKLKNLFNVHEDDIIMTNPRYGPYSITAIIKQIKFNEYSLEKLLEILLNDPDYNKILYLYIKKNILLSGCKLNKYILDSRANNNKVWGVNEIRGGKPYYPPHGWVGYGLRVADRFDNGDNSWLDYNHSKGEWSVAYIGIGEDIKYAILEMKNNMMDVKDGLDIYKENSSNGEFGEGLTSYEILKDLKNEKPKISKRFKLKKSLSNGLPIILNNKGHNLNIRNFTCLKNNIAKYKSNKVLRKGFKKSEKFDLKKLV
jgi:hypothetical protein